MGIFSRKPRTVHNVTVPVMAADGDEAAKAAAALTKVANTFTPDQMARLAKKLENALVVAQLKALI